MPNIGITCYGNATLLFVFCISIDCPKKFTVAFFLNKELSANN